MKDMLQLSNSAEEAISILQSRGYEAFAVGGCVRDSLLGKKPEDFDITTSAKPEEVEDVFKNYKVIETGIKHGTVTVLIDNSPIEITTYRIEGEYSDNRRPDSVSFTTNLKDDASRRDFTINSLAYSPRSGIVDYFGGRNDIDNRIIRCVGDPDERFKEDALRILRGVRFSSTLGFKIEPETKKAIFKNKELLRNISAERVSSELVKLLCGENVREVLVEYVDVLGVVIPELLPMIGFDQKNRHHIYDVFEHTAKAVESVPPQPSLRLAALFHDVAKPLCFSVDKSGCGHFYGHAKLGAEITDNILKRLKFDNAARELVVTLVLKHDVQIENNPKCVKRALGKLSPDVFSLLIKLKRADNMAQNPKYLYRQNYYDKLEEIACNILNENQCFSLKNLAINGNDIIALGVKPGKEIGIILAKLLDEVICGNLPNEKNALCEAAKDEIKENKN